MRIIINFDKNFSSLNTTLGDYFKEGKMEIESLCQGDNKISTRTSMSTNSSFSALDETGKNTNYNMEFSFDQNPYDSLYCHLKKQADGTYIQEGKCIERRQSRLSGFLFEEITTTNNSLHQVLGSIDPYFIAGSREIAYINKNKKIELKIKVNYLGAKTSPLILDLEKGNKYSITDKSQLTLSK